jgi:hypothetical protein
MLENIAVESELKKRISLLVRGQYRGRAPGCWSLQVASCRIHASLRLRCTSAIVCSSSDVLPVLHNTQEVAEQYDYRHLADRGNVDRGPLLDFGSKILEALLSAVRNSWVTVVQELGKVPDHAQLTF